MRLYLYHFIPLSKKVDFQMTAETESTGIGSN